MRFLTIYHFKIFQIILFTSDDKRVCCSHKLMSPFLQVSMMVNSSWSPTTLSEKKYSKEEAHRIKFLSFTKALQQHHFYSNVRGIHFDHKGFGGIWELQDGCSGKCALKEWKCHFSCGVPGKFPRGLVKGVAPKGNSCSFSTIIVFLCENVITLITFLLYGIKIMKKVL